MGDLPRDMLAAFCLVVVMILTILTREVAMVFYALTLSRSLDLELLSRPAGCPVSRPAARPSGRPAVRPPGQIESGYSY